MPRFKHRLLDKSRTQSNDFKLAPLSPVNLIQKFDAAAVDSQQSARMSANSNNNNKNNEDVSTDDESLNEILQGFANLRDRVAANITCCRPSSKTVMNSWSS